METKVIAAGGAGAAIGGVQALLLRKYVDKNYPTTNISSLKGFGTPSTLIDIAAGAVSLAIGAYGKGRRAGVQRYSDITVAAAVGYGVVALTAGVLGGIYPSVTSADCVAKGGFWYNGACHKTPQTGTVSMRGAPMVQRSTRPYTQGMNAVSMMQAEVNRLSAENSALRAQMQQPYEVPISRGGRYGFMQDESDRIDGGPIAPGSSPAESDLPAFAIPPGQPVPRATEFGFMQNQEEIAEGELVPESVLRENSDVPGPLAPEHMQRAPGQPTKKATRFGFMQGVPTNPIAKVQDMKGRYDFLG